MSVTPEQVQYAINPKITIRGKVNDSDTSTVALATWSKNFQVDKILSRLIVDTNSAKIEDFLNSLQNCTSAKVTSIAISVEVNLDDDTIEREDPGDPLDSSEIFVEEFSDTEVVPTLQVLLSNGVKNATYSLKYASDPINTTDYSRNVSIMADNLSDFTANEYGAVEANIAISAKDQTWQAE